MKKLRDAGAITEEEMKQYEGRGMKAATGTWIDQLKYGIQQAEIKAISFGEMFIQIGEKIGAQLADDLGTAFADIVTGTKNAKEAFADMARSTLQWLSQLILKTLILKALQAIPGVGSFFGAAEAIVSHGGKKPGESGKVKRYVSPDMFIGAPKYHTGEIPAIIRNDEAVLTRRQYNDMAAGQGGGSGLTFNFEGATFLDQETLKKTLVSISAMTAQGVLAANGPNVMVKAIRNDHGLRHAVRRGY